jgi:hypothetical protein
MYPPVNYVPYQPPMQGNEDMQFTNQQNFQNNMPNQDFQQNMPNRDYQQNMPNQDYQQNMPPLMQNHNTQQYYNFQQQPIDDDITKNRKDEYARTLLQQIDEKQRILK